MPAKKPKKPSKPAPQKHDFEKGVENFAEEMEHLGERFGRHCERKGKDVENWFQNTFGIVGPFLSSIFGLIIIALILWVLSLINIPIGSGLLNNVYYFLAAHIGWFFLIFLFFSYTGFVSRKFPKGYRIVSPIVSSLGIVVVIWIFSNAIKIVNLSMSIDILTNISSFLDGTLLTFFYIFILLGYLVLLVSSSARGIRHDDMKMIAKNAEREIKSRRLYRSGNERVIAGVCGGIAEYLGIDPVVVRILWVLFSLTYGTGILAYFILWIIIPRNPSHSWKY